MFIRLPKLRGSLAGLSVSLAVLLFGCSSDDEAAPPPATTPPPVSRYCTPGADNWPTDAQITEFEQTLVGTLVRKGGGNTKAHTWNIRNGVPMPALTVKPEETTDAQKAVAFARRFNIRLAMTSTGHHQDQRNTVENSLLIDFGGADEKTLNADNTITVMTGQTWDTITNWLQVQTGDTRVVLTGADTTVGPLGWATGGGHGALTRSIGLGADAMVSAQIITADGEIRTASASENSDLFWALRGGTAASFGAVVSLTFNTYPHPGLVTQATWVIVSDIKDNLATLESFLATAPDTFFGWTVIGYSTGPYVAIHMRVIGGTTAAAEVLKPLTDLPCFKASPTDCELTITMNYAGGADNGGTTRAFLASSAVGVTGLQNGALQDAYDYMIGLMSEHPGCSALCSANMVLGGASNRGDFAYSNNHTSVGKGMRQGIVALSCVAAWTEGASVKQDCHNYLNNWWETTMSPNSEDGWVYWNEPNHELPNFGTSYWGENYEALLAVKAKYDPEDIFTCHHCVGSTISDPGLCADDRQCINEEVQYCPPPRA